MQRWLHGIRQQLHTACNAVWGYCKNNPQQVLLYALIVLVVLESSSVLGTYLEDIEQWYVVQYQKRVEETREDSRIQLVTFNEDTMATPAMRQVFGRWPFPRNLYGYVVRYFSRAKAEVVFMDLAFDGGKDEEHPEHDAFFVDEVAQSTTPVLSALMGTVRKEETLSEPDENKLLFDWQTVPIANGLDPKKGQFAYSCTTNFTHPLYGLLHSPMRFSYVNDMLPDSNGKARYGILFQGSHQCVQPWVVPTAPVVLTHYRLMRRLGLNALNVPLMPLRMTEQGNDKRYQLQFLHPHTKDVVHQVNLYAFTPLVRWYGDQHQGTRSVNKATTSCTGRYKGKMMGPVLGYVSTQLCRAGFLGAHDESSQGMQYTSRGRMQKPYMETALWNVVYTELTHSCAQLGHANEPACQRFNALKQTTTIPGELVPLERFTDSTIIIGTSYQNASSRDVHTSIYGATKYPGVYILANLFDNVLHNDFVIRLPSMTKWLVAVAMSVVVAWVCFYRPVVFSSFFAAVLLGTYSALVMWLYVHHNIWLYWAVPVVSAAVVYMLSFGIRYWTSEHKKRQLRFAFGKYVSKNVMQTIEQNPEAVSLGGQRKRLTMMFTDIRGFTSYSEENPPEEVQAVLTRYFKVMHSIILQKHRGVINKLIGDAIMAYWGFPLARSDDPLDAVRAAMAMQGAMATFQADPNNPPLRIGVGLHTGDAVIGNVGSDDFMDFTVIGDAVNVAARLESETKARLPEQPCAILISETTYEAVKHAIHCRDLGEITVKGKTQSVRIYEPLSEIAVD